MKLILSAAVLLILCACSSPHIPVPVEHVISYGQSLSLGARAVMDFPIDDTIPNNYQNVGLMFKGGTRPDDLSILMPFQESTTAKDEDSWSLDTPGETVLYGALLTIQEMPGMHIGSCAGRGATDIYNLRRGTPPYQRLLEQVAAGQNLTRGTDRVSIIWMQGESDIGNLNYGSEFEQLVMDLDADVRAITHQGPVQFYVCLPAVPLIATAQQAVADAMPQVHIVCDTAILAHSDGLHLTAVSSRDAGVMLGSTILEFSQVPK